MRHGLLLTSSPFSSCTGRRDRACPDEDSTLRIGDPNWRGAIMIGHPVKVRELIEEIDRGEVLLPEIQRAYVWKGPQVSKLIDSLYREYPSGQLLLWDTAQLPVTKGIQGVEIQPGSPNGHPKIVLDDQQRLTSLYKALKEKGK